MKSVDVQDELAEGFEPTALPPVAPDGGLELPPLRAAPRHPPRLCEQGPCVNYHQFKIELDSAKPIPMRDAAGKFTPQAEGRSHEETHHYCYPSPGIELKLGSLPIIHCNRWEPTSASDLRNNDVRIKGWLESPAGRTYVAELAAFRQEQDRIALEEAVATDEAAKDLASMPASSCDLKLEIRNPAGVKMVGTVAFTWDTKLAEVAIAALMDAEYVEKTHVHIDGEVLASCECQACIPGRDVKSNYTIYRFTPNVKLIKLIKKLDPNATISQVGLISGDVVIFDYQPPKENT